MNPTDENHHGTPARPDNATAKPAEETRPHRFGEFKVPESCHVKGFDKWTSDK